MTLDFNLRAAPDARCPVCRALLLGMSGRHEFRIFPVKHVRFDLFEDGNLHDVTLSPSPAVQDFIATFAPCGCEWHGRDGSALALYVLYIIHGDDGTRFEFGHRPHDNKHSLYIMTTEGTKR